jgi:hypothetical protein
MDSSLHVYRRMALKLVLMMFFDRAWIGSVCCPRPKPRATCYSGGQAGIYGLALPLMVDVCVPARSVTETLALFVPVV